VSDEAYALSLAPFARRVPTEAPPRPARRCRGGSHRVPDRRAAGHPHRVGKPLARELAGYHSARRGAYRVVYRIDEPARTVHVVRIDHRADVYRTR
jgi:mRNA interferase RelE/StbE